MIEQFHFLRPAWLLALLPLAYLLWWLARRRFSHSNWHAVIDQRLLPHLLIAGRGGGRGWLRWLLGLTAALAIVALAGPTWEQLPQPVYQRQSALVIALDLSLSMDAADIRPSRLTRARHKIADILKLREEGQTAMVVYAADAFTVTPLTSDGETIANLLPALDTELMPAQGTRADRAIERAFELFDNSGVARGDIIVISDGMSAGEADAISRLLEDRPQLRLSVLAVGTPEGGPIPLVNGGFLKDQAGAIVIAGLGEQMLRRVARRGNGVYAAISADDLDINALTYVIESNLDSRTASRSQHSADLWRELGPGLLLLVLPLAAIAFRRGIIWLFPLALVLTPPAAEAFDWQQLWRNDNQQARQRFDAGDAAGAAEQFEHEGWRASAQYRAGDHAAALESWLRQDGETAMYNRGNALAQLGRYEEALATYDALLERNPGHADALFNKNAIEEWLEQQRQQQQSGENPDSGEQGQPGQQQDSSQAEGDAEQPAEQQQAQQSGAGKRDEEQQLQARQQDQREPAEEPAQAEGADAAPDQAQATDTASLDEQMSTQAAEQWLRKIPDDPGGLLRRKFLFQYRQRGGVDSEPQAW